MVRRLRGNDASSDAPLRDMVAVAQATVSEAHMSLAVNALEQRIGQGQHVRVTSLAVTIAGDGAHRITIEVLGRMHPGSTDYWDGNWLLSPTTVSIGGFKGRVGAGLRCDELQRFRQELAVLNETLTGTAELSSLEDWVNLRLTADSLGHVAVAGAVMDEPGIGNRLEFTFSIDQTFLPPIIGALDEIARRFPVLDGPERRRTMDI